MCTFSTASPWQLIDEELELITDEWNDKAQLCLGEARF